MGYSIKTGPRRKGIRLGSTHISGVLDLFLPLKNSGNALRSMACTLQKKFHKVT